jgi:hypothetical protein
MLRATCVVVVPAPMAMISPSAIRLAASSPIRRFSAAHSSSCS